MSYGGPPPNARRFNMRGPTSRRHDFGGPDPRGQHPRGSTPAQMGLGGPDQRGQHLRDSIPAQMGLGGLGTRGRGSRDPGLSSTGLGVSSFRGPRGQHPRGSTSTQIGLGGLGVRGRESRDPGLSLMSLEGSSFSGPSITGSVHGGPRSTRAEPSRTVLDFSRSGVPDSSMPTPFRNRHGGRPAHVTSGSWGAFVESADESGQAGASGVAVKPHQDALTADQQADEFLDSLTVETCDQQDEVDIQSQQQNLLRQERDPQARIRYENVGRRQSKGSRRRQRKAQARCEQKAKELHLPLHEADFKRRGDAGHPRWKNEEAFARDFIDRSGNLDAYPSQEEELHPSAREESFGGWDEIYREAHKTTFRVQLQQLEKEQRLRDEAELAEALKCEEARKHRHEEAAIRDWLDFWEMP